MVRVKAKPIPKTQPELDEFDRMYFLLCYHFPQYTWEDAMAMPYHILINHLTVAKEEKAGDYLQLLNISTAPHTKKGKGVKELAGEYKRAMNG